MAYGGRPVADVLKSVLLQVDLSADSPDAARRSGDGLIVNPHCFLQTELGGDPETSLSSLGVIAVYGHTGGAKSLIVGSLIEPSETVRPVVRTSGQAGPETSDVSAYRSGSFGVANISGTLLLDSEGKDAIMPGHMWQTIAQERDSLPSDAARLYLQSDYPRLAERRRAVVDRVLPAVLYLTVDVFVYVINTVLFDREAVKEIHDFCGRAMMATAVGHRRRPALLVVWWGAPAVSSAPRSIETTTGIFQTAVGAFEENEAMPNHSRLNILFSSIHATEIPREDDFVEGQPLSHALERIEEAIPVSLNGARTANPVDDFNASSILSRFQTAVAAVRV